ncbi:hypothetical protein [Streptomyces flavofungini]|uniref:hypothetical protein n=1 Tax=Streptomyces flavofungini TaxID=68200 RepID=UPI0034DF9F44
MVWHPRGRLRHLTVVALPPAHAAALFGTQDAGASEEQLRGIAAEALGGASFRDGGYRAAGLEVGLTDIEQLDIGLECSTGPALRKTTLEHRLAARDSISGR